MTLGLQLGGWTWAHPLVPMWCWGCYLKRTHGASVMPLCWAHPCAYIFGAWIAYLPEGLTHPSTRGAWAHQDPIILRSRMLQHPN